MAKFKELPDITHLNITEEERRLAMLMHRRGKGSSKSVAVDNYALEFLKDNTDDIELISRLVDLRTDFTFEWRIKFLEWAVGVNTLFGGSTGTNYGLIVGKNDGLNVLQITVGLARVRPAEITPELDKWYIIRIENRGGDFEADVYVDGDLVGVADTTGNNTFIINKFAFGKYASDGVYSPANFGSCQIDYIRTSSNNFEFPEGSGTTTEDSNEVTHNIISDRADPDDMWIKLN